MQRAFVLRAPPLLSAVLLATLTTLPAAHAQERSPDHAATFVYASLGPEQKIRIFRLEATKGPLPVADAVGAEGARGVLAPVDAIGVEGAPGALAVDPKGKFLFASLGGRNGMLATFGIDSDAGKLKLLSTARLPEGENADYLGTDRTGRWLLSVSYATGRVVVHRINDDGTIQTPAVQTVETAKTALCAVTDPGNRFVFVPHVAPNAVYQCLLDPFSGKLTEAGKIAGGTDRTGPRHLTFHPTLNVAFTADGQGSSVTAYHFDPADGLKPFQMLSTLPLDFNGRNTTTEVKVHPGGKFLWACNRGHDSLAGFAIDADSGQLKPLGHTPTEGTPRSFDLSPDGRFALSAGEGSGRLAVYDIDVGTGKLTPLYTYDVGKSLTWVLAIKPRSLREQSDDLVRDAKFDSLRDALRITPEAKKRPDELKQYHEPEDNGRPGRLEFLVRLMIENPGATLLGVVSGSVLAGLILLLYMKVKWMNTVITFPGAGKADSSIPDSDREGMVVKYVRKQAISALLFLLVAAGGLCTFGLLDPPYFAADYRIAFQVLCGVGLLASIITGAVLYLWAADRFGFK
jgi:6-phosphogluconolactonase